MNEFCGILITPWQSYFSKKRKKFKKERNPWVRVRAQITLAGNKIINPGTPGWFVFGLLKALYLQETGQLSEADGSISN